MHLRHFCRLHMSSSSLLLLCAVRGYPQSVARESGGIGKVSGLGCRVSHDSKEGMQKCFFFVTSCPTRLDIQSRLLQMQKSKTFRATCIVSLAVILIVSLTNPYRNLVVRLVGQAVIFSSWRRSGRDFSEKGLGSRVKGSRSISLGLGFRGCMVHAFITQS